MTGKPTSWQLATDTVTSIQQRPGDYRDIIKQFVETIDSGNYWLLADGVSNLETLLEIEIGHENLRTNCLAKLRHYARISYRKGWIAEISETDIATAIVKTDDLLNRPLPLSEDFRFVLTGLRRELETHIESLEKKAAINKRLRKIDAANTHFSRGTDEQYDPPKNIENSAGSNGEDAEGAQLLAKVCPLFANARPETRRATWKLMEKFTRKQWAYFADLTKILKTSTRVERGKYVEEISGLSNLRSLFGKEPPKTDDKVAVGNVITLLRADKIKSKSV